MNDIRYYDKQYDSRKLNKTSFFLYETERIEIACYERSKTVYYGDSLLTIFLVLCCRYNMNKSYK